MLVRGKELYPQGFQFAVRSAEDSIASLKTRWRLNGMDHVSIFSDVSVWVVGIPTCSVHVIDDDQSSSIVINTVLVPSLYNTLQSFIGCTKRSTDSLDD
jgi:hypothetical protein